MRIDNLLYLLEGELKNSPSITAINSISSNPKKIKRGDLFIAKDKSLIPEALKNGAYAILYEGWVQISDQEAAWIRVNSLQKALLRLLRFHIIKEQSSLYYLDNLSFEYAQALIDDPNAHFCSDLFKDIEVAIHKNPGVYIFPHNSYFQELSLDSSPLPNIPIKIIQEFLFETTFVFGERYFERIPVAPFLIDSIYPALGIAQEEFLQINLFKSFPHFTPYFLDERFKVVDFGKSERAIIHEPDLSLAPKALSFLQSKAPWAKILAISTEPLQGYYHICEIDELKKILYNRAFQYAFIVGKLPQLEQLERHKKTKTLF